MNRLFDFRRSRWGHALHAETWNVVEKSERYGFWGICRRKVVERTVLVHCTAEPEPGDAIIYHAVGHVLRRAPILEVGHIWSPRDMFKLFLGASEVLLRAIDRDALVSELTGDVVLSGLDHDLGLGLVR